MRKVLILSIMFGLCLSTTLVFAQNDIFNPIKEVIKTGNAKEVSQYLSQSVDISVDGNLNTYSKAQAEFVLRDFFKKHPPTDFNFVHSGASAKKELQYAIGRYQSNSESYTLMVRVKEVGGQNLIHELTFQKE
ncbi:MAG TPA: DUF4783 domain-containing protein [Cyclobacteriaceae bacterium]|nr:DUF4783 domain-containing protein [Cyclobacteriaceae bacterium]